MTLFGIAFGLIELALLSVFLVAMVVATAFDRRGSPATKWSIVLIGLIVFFQILVTTRDAARAIHPNYLLTMRTLGASRAQIYRHVIWPATLPRILTALRISIGTAVAILFFVESFATTRGLGFVIMDAWGQADYERLYAGIVAMAALGLCLYLLLDLVEERVCRWTRTA